MNHEVMLKLPKITIFSMRRSCILHLCIYVYSEHFWVACVIWCRTTYYLYANSTIEFRWCKLTESELFWKKKKEYCIWKKLQCFRVHYWLSVWLQMQHFVSELAKWNFRTENKWRDQECSIFCDHRETTHKALIEVILTVYASVLHDVHRMSAILKEIII